MAAINIPLYVVKRNNRAYWQPQAALRTLGFQSVPLGPDGPDAWEKARKLNLEADRARMNGDGPGPQSVYPVGTLGDFFERSVFNLCRSVLTARTHGRRHAS